MAENFIIGLIAALKKGASKKQIQEDAKNLGDIKVPLVGRLNKARTKAQLKRDLSSMNGTVNLTGKFNSKGVTASVKQATAQAQKQANATPVQMSFAVKKENLINDIKLLAQQNSRLFKNTDMTAKYNFLLDNAKLASTESQVSNLRMQLIKFNVELKETKYSGMTLIDVLKNGLSKVLLLFGNHGIIKQFTAQLRNAWKEAQELDASITSLSKVCDELADRSLFPAYIDKSISKAKELCTDVNDLLYAVTEFKKLGNTLKNSEILAEYAIRLQNVGDTNIDTAISSIKTAMATFDEIGGYTDNEYENKVEAYIDLINNLSKKFSIDAESLANAVRISAGTLVEANTSIEEAASIITAANKYYDDPSYLANTIKIGALRLRASKTSDEAKELAELGENIDDLAESTSNLREEMLALTGVDIMVDDKNFKSYYQQLLDISKVYQSLDETTQANVLEKMFGKNRSAAGANVLKAMSDSGEVYNEALQSAGSSQEEFSRWTESAEAATKRFGVAMTETYNNIISGDTVKGLSNVGATLLDFANKLGLVEKGLKGILIIGTMKGITTLTVAFKNSAIQISNYGKALDAVKDLNTYAQGTQKYADAMNTLKKSCANLTDAQLKQVLANRKLDDSQLKEILQLDSLKKKQREARLAQLGLIKTTKEQTTVNGKASTSMFSLSSAVKGLGAKFRSFWASNKITITIMAISAAINLVTSAISKHKQKLEEARQKASELADAYKQQQSTLDSQIKKYKELKESLDNGNLSTDEARYVKEQLLDIQNSLIDSYDVEASNIDLVNGKYKEQLGLLNELSKEKAEDFVVENRDVFEDAKKELERIRSFKIGSLFDYNVREGKSDLQKQLYEYVKSYSELFEIRDIVQPAMFKDISAPTLYVNADVQSAEEVMRQFAKDLEEYAEKNAIDVSGILNNIPKQLRKTQTDELKEYRKIYDKFMNAEVVRNDTLRPLYQQSVQAVEEYNNALSTGEGIAEAKAKLDSLQQSVQNAAGELEGSQEVFDGIYEGINKNAEAAYQLSQVFGTDNAVQKYAEQLRGLSDVDIKAINLENENIEKGEKAFRGLLETLGYTDPTEEQIQNLIDKLVELGYVTGEAASSVDVPAAFSDIFSLKSAESTLTTLGKISESIDTLQNAYKTLSDAIGEYNEEGAFSVDTLQSVIALGDNWLDYLVNGEGKLKLNKESLEQLTRARLNDMHAQAINNVINNVAKIQSDEDAIKYLTSTNYALAESYEEVAQMKLMDARASLEAAVAAGTLSEENMHAAMAKASDDIAKIKRLFMNTGIDADSILGGSGSSSSAISEKDTIKEFDWIGQAIENVEKEVKKLDEIANSSYATFSQKNAALAKEISKVNEEIVLQQQAYEEYMRKADAIGLGEDYKVLVRDGAINIENISDEDLQNKISDYQKWHEKAVAVSDAISGLNEQLKDLHVRGYELRAERLEDLLNNASITEKQYLEEMKSLYKEYYENQVEYAQKAHEAKLALLKKEKSYLNSVAGAASSLLDREIDKIRDNAEAQEKPLKNQIDAYNEQIDLLNKKKKPLQDELDALEDKARDENLILDLQQKQYNLKRLENQRTKLVYTADQGMIYTSDSSAIRDAKKDVDSAKQEIQKNDIQKQIDALDDEIDRYNDLIDLVNDQIDAVNSAADAQINALEKVKNKWQEVIDQQEYAANISLLTGEFGTNAIEKLLSGNDDDLLAQWKNSYVNTLAGLDMETQGYIGNMTQQIASLYNVELSVLQSQFQGVKDSVASLDNTIRNETDTAASAFDQHTNKLTNEVVPAIQDAATEMDTFNESAQIAESSIEKANATLSAFSETANKLPVDVFNSMAQSAQSLSGALDHIANTAIGSTSTQLKDILSDANGIVDTIKHGNAYGEGAPGLANDEKNALRSAYAGGTGKDAIITPDGAVLRPLQPGDPMYDTMQKWNAYMDGINHNVDKAVPNSMYDYNKRMHEIVNQITNSSIVNHTRNMQPVTVNQNVTLNCPNLTNNSGIEYVRRELGHLSQMATQEPLKDY